jgi:hypothetical protein
LHHRYYAEEPNESVSDECMKRPIENNSSPGQAVYEPFSGSGTTIIAAEITGRICHAIELNPAHIDVAITRQDFTGENAILESNQRSFAKVTAERGEPMMNRTALAALWPPTAVAAGEAGHRPMSPVEAIRRKCLDCPRNQPRK